MCVRERFLKESHEYLAPHTADNAHLMSIAIQIGNAIIFILQRKGMKYREVT